MGLCGAKEEKRGSRGGGRRGEQNSSDSEFLGSVFDRTDFSRIFIVGPPDFFMDSVANIFLLQENPQNLHHKNSRHDSVEGLGQEFSKNRSLRLVARLKFAFSLVCFIRDKKHINLHLKCETKSPHVADLTEI